MNDNSFGLALMLTALIRWLCRHWPRLKVGHYTIDSQALAEALKRKETAK